MVWAFVPNVFRNVLGSSSSLASKATASASVLHFLGFLLFLSGLFQFSGLETPIVWLFLFLGGFLYAGRALPLTETYKDPKVALQNFSNATTIALLSLLWFLIVVQT